MAKDWIPSGESELVKTCERWDALLADRTITAACGWSEEQCAAVAVVLMTYVRAFADYAKNDSTAMCSAKNQAKTEAKRVMREFANEHVRFNRLVEDPVRTALGIRPRDTTPTVHPRPAERPETVVENTKNRLEHNVMALNPETRTATRPADAHGVRFAWKVGGEKPAGGEDLPKGQFSRKTSIRVAFPEADKGKPVWYATCYENTRGEAGLWSLLAEAYIG